MPAVTIFANPERDLCDIIRAGDRVQIRQWYGRTMAGPNRGRPRDFTDRWGRAVTRGPYGWVLNMGGAHGTPAIANNENILKVKPAAPAKNPPRKSGGIRTGSAHPRSYRADLPLRGFTAGQLTKATKADFEAWKARPLTYARTEDQEWAALVAEQQAGLTAAGLWEVARKTGGGETGKPHPRSYGAHLPMGAGVQEGTRATYAWPPLKRNPPRRRARGIQVSKNVIEIRYIHVANGRAYKHPFGRGVCAELLPDGSVRLYHANGKPLMGEF